MRNVIVTLVGLLIFVASAQATEHDFELQPMPSLVLAAGQPYTQIVTIEIWSDGNLVSTVPAPQLTLEDDKWAWRFTAIAWYGHDMEAVLVDDLGQRATSLNTQSFGGCHWDLDNSGVVGSIDYSMYLMEVSAGTATTGEFSSMLLAYGMTGCPVG